MLQKLNLRNWNETLSSAEQQQAIGDLESGNILFFPDLAFTLNPNETFFLSPDHADPHAKNISYHAHHLWGVQRLTDAERIQLTAMMERYSQYARNLIAAIFPRYVNQITIARTSFRPVQICGRKTSYRKDDKRLHVDAFPSSPNQGKRILRVFSNINPNNEDRVWRTGEPFEQVAQRFLPGAPQPIPGKAAALRFLKITKSYRTAYDHYMLHIHDRMKADEKYQIEAGQREVRFPPNTTWIVQTDDVSHAAMQGQFVLEQTFSLPVEAMQNEALSPLRVLERLLGKALI